MAKKSDYERRRDELIPTAEAFADRTVGVRPDDNFEGWAGRWNKAFLGEMDRLARRAGLTR